MVKHILAVQRYAVVGVVLLAIVSIVRLS